MTTPAELDTLISLLNNLRLSRYTTVSAATVLSYDVLLTFGEEVRLIWCKGKVFSWGKIIFLVIRYYSIASALVELWVVLNTNPSKRVFVLKSPHIQNETRAECLAGRVWYQWQTVSILIVLMMTEAVLLLRIWALYGQSKKIILFTSSLFVVFVGADISLVYLCLINVDAVPFALIPGMRVCVPFSMTTWTGYWATWVPIIGVETTLFVLALLKGYQYLLRRFRLGWSNNSLLDVLIRDSIVYYFVNFAIHVATLTIWSVNIELLDVPAVFAVVMPVVMSSRLLLNIRETHYNGTTLRTISELNTQNLPGIYYNDSSSDSESELSNPA